MLIDPEKEEAKFFKSNLDKKISKEQYEFMIKGEGFYNFDLKQKGVHYGVYKYKKPLYLKHFSESSKKSNYEFENQLIEKLNLQSLIIFPLIYNNEIFGFFDITHADEPLKLTKEEYLNLNIFIQYFSLIFKNYLLFQEIQQRKEELEKINQNIIQQNQLVLRMNYLLSIINKSYDIKSILEKVIEFLKENCQIDYYLFYRYHKSQNSLIYEESNLETELDPEIIEQIKKNPIKLEKPYGIHALSCIKHKSIYQKKTKDPLENSILEILQLKLESLLIFPLYIEKELLGILDLAFLKKKT